MNILSGAVALTGLAVGKPIEETPYFPGNSRPSDTLDMFGPFVALPLHHVILNDEKHEYSTRGERDAHLKQER